MITVKVDPIKFNCEACGEVLEVGANGEAMTSAQTLAIECPECRELHVISVEVAIWSKRTVMSNKSAILDAIQEEEENRKLDAEIMNDEELSDKK